MKMTLTFDGNNEETGVYEKLAAERCLRADQAYHLIYLLREDLVERLNGKKETKSAEDLIQELILLIEEGNLDLDRLWT